MHHRLIRFARTALFAAAVLLPAAGNAPAASPSVPDAAAEIAKAPYEVRLRKLHLVRPDLIPYPVFFEVYC